MSRRAILALVLSLLALGAQSGGAESPSKRSPNPDAISKDAPAPSDDEGRHGSAEVPRADGGLGAISGPPAPSDDEGRPGSAGVPRADGGLGAMSGPPDQTDARAAQVEAARRYRASLDVLMPLHEAAVERATADVERRRALLAQGLIARVDVEAAERALADARATAARTQEAIHEADGLVAEAEAVHEIAALPAAGPGETQERPSLIRYAGAGRWSLAAVPALERFFKTRFGQPLPISALGQTAAHERLGFDHRNGLDVAVHPDSPAGRALLDHLRAHGIPFLAFRAARPGVATGAHVHVGEPSARLSSGGRITGRATGPAGAPGEAR